MTKAELHHQNFAFGVGPATPMGSSTDYLGATPLIRFGDGYRFSRLFQADRGLQIAFGAVNNPNPELTDLGPVQGGDHELMIPLGASRFRSRSKGSRFRPERTECLYSSETAPSRDSSSCHTCTAPGRLGASMGEP